MRAFLRDQEILSTIAVFVSVSIFMLATFVADAFPWSIFFLSFTLAVILILTNPRVGLFSIILLTMVWEQFFTLQPLLIFGVTFKLYPLDILLAATLVAFGVHWAIERHHQKLLRNPRAPTPMPLRSFGVFEKMLVLFAVLATVYFFQSQIAPDRNYEVAFSTFKGYAFYTLITFLVIGLLRTREQYLRFMWTLFTGGAMIGIFILIGFFRGRGLWIEATLPLSTEGVRYLGFPHSYYISIVFLIAMSVFAHRLFAHPMRMLALMGLQFLGIVGSLMRHLWMAMAVGAVVLLFMGGEVLRRQFMRLGQFALLFLLFLLFTLGSIIFFFPESGIGIVGVHFVDALVARVASFGDITDDISALWRIKFWQTVLAAFFGSPVFGIGFGQDLTFDVRGWVSTIHVRDVHNSLLGLLAQMGIVGFGFFVAMHVVLIVSYLRRRGRLGFVRPYADGVFAAYIAFFIAANFQPYLETNLLNIFFWMLVGLLRVAPTLTEKPAIDWSHLRMKKHLQLLESTHRRGVGMFR